MADIKIDSIKKKGSNDRYVFDLPSDATPSIDTLDANEITVNGGGQLILNGDITGEGNIKPQLVCNTSYTLPNLIELFAPQEVYQTELPSSATSITDPLFSFLKGLNDNSFRRALNVGFTLIVNSDSNRGSLIFNFEPDRTVVSNEDERIIYKCHFTVKKSITPHGSLEFTTFKETEVMLRTSDFAPGIDILPIKSKITCTYNDRTVGGWNDFTPFTTNWIITPIVSQPQSALQKVGSMLKLLISQIKLPSRGIAINLPTIIPEIDLVIMRDGYDDAYYTLRFFPSLVDGGQNKSVYVAKLAKPDYVEGSFYEWIYMADTINDNFNVRGIK